MTATDAAPGCPASGRSSRVVFEKLLGSGFGGNAYTDYGREREPHIAALGAGASMASPEHRPVPVPAGTAAHGHTGRQSPSWTARSCSAEIKTTNKPWRSIPRSYLRQIWWQQYVVGAERTLLVWEQHADFVPVNAEPQCRWIERDDNQIHVLVGLANRVLELAA